MVEQDFLQVRVLSSQRVFPETRSTSPSTVPLSIVDATVANFSPAGGIWFFDQGSRDAPAPAAHLHLALTRTLNTYQPWTGQLTWAPYDPQSHDHINRFRRLQVTWGTSSDPGAEFVTASSSKTLASIIPHADERAKTLKAWDHTNINLDRLLPSTQLALRHLQTKPNAPALAIQLTTFACHSVAVAIVLSHPLGDATTLAQFVRDLTFISQSLLSRKPSSIVPPTFDPQQLDRAAAGEIDAFKPDLRLLSISRALPSLRYDWWAEGEECPWPGALNAQIPKELDAAHISPDGDPIPWSLWNTEAPCSLYILHFNGQEITRIWEEANSPTSHVSRHDALMAFLWKLTNRARQLEDAQSHVHLNMSLGLRQRLSPPLPDNFLGSPIVLADIQLTGQEASTQALSNIAQRIKATLGQFNSETVPALLHDMLYQDSPPRIWRGFFGLRHLMVTSWVHLKLYDIDFGLGMGKPRYVEAVLTNIDGLIQVMELGNRQEGGHWSDGGVDVFLSLEAEALKRLLEDPLLRQYED